ncbi:hypothetical protein BH10CHL1_BH10CHL1_39320 [soil metagenome]
MVASTRLNNWLLIGLAAVAIWLPRGLQLGRYVTDDEQKWLARSANFYWALDHGDFAATFQREHPGVTVMWAGALGFLWRYAAYAHDAPGLVDWGDNDMDKILRAHGQQPLQLLAAGRVVLVLAITLTLTLALFYAITLLGRQTAIVGFGLLAFDPYHIALSRLLHLDGLVSSLMLLAVLAFLAFLQRKDQVALGVSAIAAGLAWLTKTPAFFLIPLIGLTALLYQRGQLFNRSVGRAQLLRFLWPLLGWGAIALAVYVIGWPAMWVQPLSTLRYVFGESLAYATGTHLSQIYFNGRVLSGDPGLLFYPLVYLWRSTPVVWLGLLLLICEWRWPSLDPTVAAAADERAGRKFTLAMLLLFAVSYGLLISVGIKKLDRYLLPVFAPLDLIAAVGWLGLTNRLRLLNRSFKMSFALPVLVAILLVWQLGLALNTFPYFLTYFNPWLGGLTKASRVMMIGRGEGLDLVAAYLNAKPEAAQLKTLVTSTDNLVYSSQGRLVTTSFMKNPALSASEKMLRWLTLDTAVLYVNDWQRQAAPTSFLDFFAGLQPEQSIQINHLEYARIYNLRQAPVPAFLAAGVPGYTTWDKAIRLAAYELPSTPLKAGERFTALFYLQNVGPIAQNLNEQIRVVGADGHEIAKVDGWPWGSPTSTWQRYVVWPDGHEFTIPADTPAGSYPVELSFYEPATLDRLAAVDLRTGQATANPIVIAVIKVITQ